MTLRPVLPETADHQELSTQYVYFEEFQALRNEIAEVEHSTMGSKWQIQARKKALEEAKRVLAELKRHTVRNSKEVLLLAEVSARIKHGLHFIAGNQTPFKCKMFQVAASSTISQELYYDAKFHQASMLRLSEMGASLKGSGWKDLRNSLWLLAAALLVAAGMLLAIPTAGTSLAIALSGAAALTACVGFFAGRDTGSAGAVLKTNLQTPDDTSIYSEDKPPTNFFAPTKKKAQSYAATEKALYAIVEDAIESIYNAPSFADAQKIGEKVIKKINRIPPPLENDRQDDFIDLFKRCTGRVNSSVVAYDTRAKNPELKKSI